MPLYVPEQAVDAQLEFLRICQKRDIDGYVPGVSDDGNYLVASLRAGGFGGIVNAEMANQLEAAGLTPVIDESRGPSAAANNIAAIAARQAYGLPGVYQEIAEQGTVDFERWLAGDGPPFDTGILLDRLLYGDPPLDGQAAIDNPTLLGIDLTRMNDLTLLTKTNRDPDVTADTLAKWTVRSSMVPGIAGELEKLPDGTIVGDGELAGWPPEYSAMRDILATGRHEGRNIYILTLYNDLEPTAWKTNKLAVEIVSRLLRKYGDPGIDTGAKFKRLAEVKLALEYNLHTGRFAHDLGITAESLRPEAIPGERLPRFATTNQRTLAVGRLAGANSTRQALNRAPLAFDVPDAVPTPRAATYGRHAIRIGHALARRGRNKWQSRLATV